MQLTPGECMEAIVSAIFAASKDPLSIITAGVGDGAIRPCLLDVPKGTLRQHDCKSSSSRVRATVLPARNTK